ncbi:MAG: DUF1365 domain-containing protein [Verrucomicrobiota bacterium]
MSAHSTIYRGEVTHKRLGPTEHAFSYPVTFFGFDLGELPTIAQSNPLFGYNEARPVTIRDRDYLQAGHTSIQQKLESLLGPEAPGQRTLLITSPRYFGYAFNPVNFHLRMQGDQLLAAVAEVNNTFGDRHVYPLDGLEAVKPQTWTARCAKDFHVSPFNNMQGDYHFTFRIEADEIYLGVDLHRDGDYVLKTWIQGTKRALNQSEIIKYFLLHPFDTALNSMPRIVWQAALLHYKKKLDVHQRPKPASKSTIVDRDHPDGRRAII